MSSDNIFRLGSPLAYARFSEFGNEEKEERDKFNICRLLVRRRGGIYTFTNLVLLACIIHNYFE